MTEQTTSLGWWFELDGFAHTVELGTTRLGHGLEVYLDGVPVLRLPRLIWTLVSIPFRIGSHQAVLDAGFRRRGPVRGPVYGLRISGVALGPPKIIDGPPGRPALGGSRVVHRWRRRIGLATVIALVGLAIALVGRNALTSDVGRGGSLDPLVSMIGLATLVGAPLAIVTYAGHRRWGAIQELFLQVATPFVAGYVIGGALGTVLPPALIEAIIVAIGLASFAILGVVCVVGGGLSIAGRRRGTRGAAPGSSLSIAGATGSIILGTAALAFVGITLAAVIGVAGSSLHDAGPTLAPIVRIPIGLAGIGLVLLLIGRPRPIEPGPDLG